MESDDHELMIEVRDGDTARLGLLFEKHQGPLYGFFVRLSGDRSASEDLVQQVFLRIFKYRHTYRDVGSFRAWMYQLARHVLADHRRKSASAPSVFADPETIHLHPDENPDAAASTEHGDNLSLLRRALASLDAEQREILVLHRFQRLPHEELAALQRCSVGAMKVRVHRALAALRDAFHSLQRGGSPLTDGPLS